MSRAADPHVAGANRGRAGEPASSPEVPLGAILLSGLQALADAGEAERACRLAGRACAALRGKDDALWRRFNGLLHRLAPRAGAVGSASAGGPEKQIRPLGSV